MILNNREHAVVSFYSQMPQIGTYPLKPTAIPEDVLQRLQESGYQVSRATREMYPNLFRINFIFEGESSIHAAGTPDEPFVVSKWGLKGVIRYRRHQKGNSVKIESSDPAIKDALAPILA